MKTNIAPNPKLADSQRRNNQNDYERTAEMVDNSIDAGATKIFIEIEADSENQVKSIIAIDNGSGMDENDAKEGLRFGSENTTRSADKLGGFGNALKANYGSHIEIISKKANSKYIRAIYDVTNITKTRNWIADIGTLESKDKAYIESFKSKLQGAKTGTMITCTHLDLLRTKDAIELESNLYDFLAETYRHQINSGIEIYVNGNIVNAIDIFLSSRLSIEASATETIRIEGKPFKVKVRVGYLPKLVKNTMLHRLQKANYENQGYYIMRNDRQIERAKNIFPNKVKHPSENRFRGEISFEGYPEMDTAFSISPQKNYVHPSPDLLDELWSITEPLLDQVRAMKREEDKKSGKSSRGIDIPTAINKGLNKRIRNRLEIRGIEVEKVEVGLSPLPTEAAEIMNPDMNGKMAINLSQDHPLYETLLTMGNPARLVVVQMLIAMKKAETDVVQQNPTDVGAMHIFNRTFNDALRDLLVKETLVFA